MNHLRNDVCPHCKGVRASGVYAEDGLDYLNLAITCRDRYRCAQEMRPGEDVERFRAVTFKKISVVCRCGDSRVYRTGFRDDVKCIGCGNVFNMHGDDWWSKKRRQYRGSQVWFVRAARWARDRI